MTKLNLLSSLFYLYRANELEERNVGNAKSAFNCKELWHHIDLCKVKKMSQNPFTTRFGILPQVLLDRDELIDDLIEELKDSYSDAQATLITGLRGSGKTVLTVLCLLISQYLSYWSIKNKDIV